MPVRQKAKARVLFLDKFKRPLILTGLESGKYQRGSRGAGKQFSFYTKHLLFRYTFRP